jgi:hypothetical protein
MLTTIDFYGQLCLETNKVDDVVSERVLPAKLEATYLFSLQRPPETSFSIGHALAQSSLELRSQDPATGLAFHVQ